MTTDNTLLFKRTVPKINVSEEIIRKVDQLVRCIISDNAEEINNGLKTENVFGSEYFDLKLSIIRLDEKDSYEMVNPIIYLTIITSFINAISKQRTNLVFSDLHKDMVILATPLDIAFHNIGIYIGMAIEVDVDSEIQTIKHIYQITQEYGISIHFTTKD